jgi:prefoldin subunit 4
VGINNIPLSSPWALEHERILDHDNRSLWKKLSKDEEAATGTEDTEVRREDQDKINRFSRLHQRETVLEERLKAKQVRLSFPDTIHNNSLDADALI